MRTISKGSEPVTLLQHRKTSHATYDSYADKDGLRLKLVAEQRGLCCYCLSRIRPTREDMKIAHWRSQAKHPTDQLNFANLLGACKGGEGQPATQQHCDTRQGNRDLSRNPSVPSHRVEEMVRFRPDGWIASNDSAFDKEINEILNLNLAFLRNNRKSVLDAFQKAMGGVPVTRSWLQKQLRIWNGENSSGDLEPYCQVIVYWLRKRLDRPT